MISLIIRILIKLIAQQVLMNWIGIVAALFDLFAINGNAEKLSGNPIVGPHPQPMSGPKVEDTVDPKTDLSAGSETEQ